MNRVTHVALGHLAISCDWSFSQENTNEDSATVRGLHRYLRRRTSLLLSAPRSLINSYVMNRHLWHTLPSVQRGAVKWGQLYCQNSFFLVNTSAYYGLEFVSLYAWNLACELLWKFFNTILSLHSFSFIPDLFCNFIPVQTLTGPAQFVSLISYM